MSVHSFGQSFVKTTLNEVKQKYRWQCTSIGFNRQGRYLETRRNVDAK